MSGFIRGEFEGTEQPWSEDPASTLVDELEHELVEELDAEVPAYHQRPDRSVVGRLVDEDGGALADHHSEAIAIDSHDDTDLSAEETAVHFVDEEGDDSDPDLTAEVRAELEGFA